MAAIGQTPPRCASQEQRGGHENERGSRPTVPQSGRQAPLFVPRGDYQAAKRRGRGCRCEGRAESVQVEDWDSGETRAVPLDPRKTGVQAGPPRPIHPRCRWPKTLSQPVASRFA